jgi:c-di-GMP-binding flagellar brake protein YcgR
MQPASESMLSIGQRLEISIRKHWWATRLEDWDGQKLLTVAWPVSTLRNLLLLELGQTVELAVVVPGDGIYVADCQIDELVHGAVPMVKLRVQGEWQRSQRRNAVRVRVAVRPRVADVIYGEKARRPVRLGVVDVSATGVHVRSQDELRAGDLLDLAFDLDGEVHVKARVRRIERNERVWDAGCAFEDVSEAETQRIVRFIFAQQRAVLRARSSAR